MKKSDLKTGMQIERRVGGRRVIMLDTPSGDVYCGINGDSSCISLSHYNMDLTSKNSYEGDIVAVYSNGLADQYTSKKISDRYCVWERKEENPILNYKGIDWSESTIKSMIDKFHK